MLNQNRHYWTPPKWLGSSALSPSDRQPTNDLTTPESCGPLGVGPWCGISPECGRRLGCQDIWTCNQNQKHPKTTCAIILHGNCSEDLRKADISGLPSGSRSNGRRIELFYVKFQWHWQPARSNPVNTSVGKHACLTNSSFAVHHTIMYAKLVCGSFGDSLTEVNTGVRLCFRCKHWYSPA